ncbi:YkgJ family cysteine cluster protein [Acidovorax sp.]|uniref:YkgJ family cysteine cluster protein n=1 Tax=Acidovorax sp. TaxID=1872122 RepID=UPI0025BFA9EB|nr:YkgJ family cysteine cluster protein [Acidovorax sp.]
MAWLRKAADYVNAGAAHLAACRKGCAACCHIAVIISRGEAQVIARETGAKLNPNAGVFSMADSEDFGEAFKQATSGAVGKPCSFLTEGSCSIYAHRPLECRLLLNLDDDDLLCQLVEGSATNVPYMDARQHHVASVAILGPHQHYDDIRNWFPQGRANDTPSTQQKAD